MNSEKKKEADRCRSCEPKEQRRIRGPGQSGVRARCEGIKKLPTNQTAGSIWLRRGESRESKWKSTIMTGGKTETYATPLGRECGEQG